MLEPDRAQALASVFQQYPTIQAVYVFGSVAAGTPRAGSDLDLAVCTRDNAPPMPAMKLDLLADLTRRGVDDVDLVFLSEADLVLQYEAVRQNQLVYRAPDFNHGAFFSKTIRQYWDFLPHLRRQRKAYKRRLLHG